MCENDNVGLLCCIRCEKTLESAQENPTTPYAGTEFDARGQWGSTVFDPNDPRLRLEIVVCDECMKLAASKKLIAYTVYEKYESPWKIQKRMFWDPDYDELQDR